MRHGSMKTTLLFGLLLIAGALHAQQQPGVDCVPVQGNGWQGCAPINQTQQQQQPQVPQPPPQVWEDHYGAMATNEPGNVLGVAVDMRSESEAKQSAIADCQTKGGGSSCAPLISYRNGCAVLLVGDKFFNASSAATIEEATQSGMKVCAANGNTNCHIYYSACSLPVRVQ